jgi:hypothetical protein
MVVDILRVWSTAPAELVYAVLEYCPCMAYLFAMYDACSSTVCYCYLGSGRPELLLVNSIALLALLGW